MEVDGQQWDGPPRKGNIVVLGKWEQILIVIKNVLNCAKQYLKEIPKK